MSSRTYADDLFPLEVAEQPTERMSPGSSPTTSPNSVDALNGRIHVGWMATPLDASENLDRQVTQYCTKLGEFKYSFVVFPVGGVVRAFWNPDSLDKTPPPIDLPDVQLANSLWETYITGKVSPWIDCDSEDPAFAALSEENLLKELNYVCYLGLQTMTIELKRISSPKTAAIINKWIWTKNSRFTVWVQLPSSLEKCVDYKDSLPQSVDLWSVWADFRKLCGNFSGMYLQVALTVSADLPDEFTNTKQVERWKAEPLGAFIVDSDVFMSGKEGGAVLTSAHTDFLQALWSTDSLRFVVRPTNPACQSNESVKLEYSSALRAAVQNAAQKRRQTDFGDSSADSAHFLNVLEYKDVLQAPLQPLSDNLDSGVYNTFEQDQMKYIVYGQAVEGALVDLGADGRKSVVVYLLGGGRGPIGSKILRAEKTYNENHRRNKSPLRVKLYIVEKNPNAIVTLKYMNVRWKRRVTIVESDMRSLPAIARDRGFEQPDIIVSELLGSFGDNELSPECLDGVTEFLKPTTISIPQKYTSYVLPIMSTHLHQTIKSQSVPYLSRALPSHGRLEPELEENGMWIQRYPQGHVRNNMDQIYVVYLNKYIPLAPATKPVFTFEHPNFSSSSNERSTSVEFDIDRNADLMGFGGYFDLQLYKNVMLSIEPSSHTPGMVSWFPAVIPLRDQLRVADGDKIRLKMDRKVDEKGVWYEWHVELQKFDGSVTSSPVQNPNGESYYMRM